MAYNVITTHRAPSYGLRVSSEISANSRRRLPHFASCRFEQENAENIVAVIFG
jgi:hypothetical protein